MSTVVISGDTSGSITLQAPAVSGTTTLTLPATSGTVLQSGTAVTEAQGGTGTTTGYYGFKNRIINGGMDIAQRGTSFTSTSSANNDDTYVLDRFYILSDGNDIVDVTQTTTVPTGAKYSIGLDVETVNKKFGIAQIIENANCYDAIGGNVTVSFQAKVSSTTNLDNVKCAIVAWSGTADTVTSDIISAWGVEGTNPTLIANATYENSPANLNVTTSFATYSVTANVDTASTSNIILFIWSDVTTTSLGEFLYITNVQLEKGSTATSFDYRPYGTELQLCQRYYWSSGAIAPPFTTGHCRSTTAADYQFPLKVTMRSAPTLSSTNSGAYMQVAGSNYTITSIAAQDSSHPDVLTFRGNVASGLTAGYASVFGGGTATVLNASAEL